MNRKTCNLPCPPVSSQSPQFDLGTYSGRDSDALKPPLPVKQLPPGPDHITLQYLLGTVNIPEASYADNDQLLEEWARQIGWENMGEKMTVALKKVVAWIGDHSGPFVRPIQVLS